MKRKLGSLLVLGAVVLLIPFAMAGREAHAASGGEQAIPLQQLIDEAKPGDTLTLASGEYAGPAVIDKRLTLTGDAGAVVSYDGEEPVLSIRSDGVAVQGIGVVSGFDGDTSAIGVYADEVSLQELHIETRSFGILLREADRGMIGGNRIVWSGANGNGNGKGSRTTSFGQKSNGIDLYDSHDNRIEDNEIRNMRDGIYLENSHRTIVDGNRIYHSRYGIHCMYTNGTQVVNNEGEYNVTGAMVMGVSDAFVSGNSFRKQSENVNSQGILLFDVQTSQIVDNIVEGNRVGFYMEQSSNNELRNNAVLRNFMGIEFIESADNAFTGNVFIANVIEAEALDSSGNRMDGNYWDAVQGLDLNEDGFSDIPYAINPFYPSLIDRNAAFQLFFQAPGMTFLSGMFTDDRDNWSRDATPLMQPPFAVAGMTATKEASGTGARQVAAIGFALLAAALITILWGAKRR